MPVILKSFFNPIFPVFSIFLVGYILAKNRLFDRAGAQAINRFVFYVALPGLLFSLVSSAAFDAKGWQVVALYTLSEGVLFVTGTAVARCLFKRDWDEAILLGMAACFANHAFFILPIAQILYGKLATVTITAIIAVDTTVIFAGTIIGLEIAAHQREKSGHVVHHLVRNPVLIAIFAGVLVNVLGIHLHPGVHTFTRLTGGAAAPAALFSLGIILSGAGAATCDWTAFAITALKVVLHPLVAATLLQLAILKSIGCHSALLVAAGPCGAMPFVLAMQYQVDPRTIGRAIIYSTGASLFTLAAITAYT